MKKIITIVPIIWLISSANSYATVVTQDVEDDDAKGAAFLIIDNSGNQSKVPGIKTNFGTGVASGGSNAVLTCAKNEALEQVKCNSFNTGNNDLQVMIRQPDGKLSVEVGVFNSKSTRYNLKNTKERMNYFDAGKHVFDLDKFRDAADALSLRYTSTLPKTGTMSWKQFLQNVAAGNTLYGFVRVKVPLQQIKEAPKPGLEKENLGKSGKRYGLCGKKKENTCGCGPGKDDDGDGEFETTNIKAGETICDVKMPSNAQISVRGSIMFDWVDCEKPGQPPIPLDDLPASPRDIYFKVSVPININPANPRAGDGVLNHIDEIAKLTQAAKCASKGDSCSVELNNQTLIDYAWVSPEAKAEYFYKKGTELNADKFAQLSFADRYNLLMPSGYENGWSAAFTELGITHKYWQETLKFRSNVSLDKNGDNTRYNDVITKDDIRSTNFEDIPVYIYTGGLVDMHHHVNISGLVYVPQAIELEQKGIKLEKRLKLSEKESDDRSSSFSGKSKSTTDYHNHEIKSCGRPTEHYEQRIPAKQYISGVVLVRDAFYIEATLEGGVTLISHDHDSYDQTRLADGVATSSRVTVYQRSATGGGAGASPAGENPGNGNGNSSKDDEETFKPSGQWIEIKPR